MNTQPTSIHDVAELITALQYAQEFNNKLTTWDEYQAKMRTMSVKTLREVAVIFEVRRAAEMK